MINKRSILFIINPISGTGKKKIIEGLLKQLIVSNDIGFEVKYTEYAGHASIIAKDAVESGDFDTVVAVGGDGSVNEVSSSLIRTNVKMGIIPTGSGNGFARHLGIPLKYELAIKTIVKGSSSAVDSAEVNNRRFVGVAGVGFDAFISKKFDEAPTRGFWTYFKLALSSYFNYKEKDYTIIADGNEVVLPAFIISFCNSCQWGNNAFICPNAVTHDGNLRLAIVRKMPLYALPGFAIRLFKKSIGKSKYYKEIVFKKACIKKQENLLHIDGEPIEEKGDLNLQVNPASLNVIH